MATQPIKPRTSDKTYATATVTTAADGLSDVISMDGYELSTIQMSTAWTTANLTFMGSVTSTANMQSIRHTTACTELTYATTVNYQIAVSPGLLAGMRHIQLRSGSTTTPVAQAAARTIHLGFVPIRK